MVNDLRKLLILDMDGTIYNYKQGSYSKSSLKKTVLVNAKAFIMIKLKITGAEAEKILNNIVLEHGEHISVALEKIFGIDRIEYFNNVWDINPKGLVKQELRLRIFLLELINKGYELVIVSDAPRNWITNVLKYLRIEDIFEGKIFSGESDNRKAFGNVFNNLIKKLNYQPKDCIIVGDQEETEIIPAKESGVTSVFVHKQKVSKLADFSIKSVFGLNKVLNF